MHNLIKQRPNARDRNNLTAAHQSVEKKGSVPKEGTKEGTRFVARNSDFFTDDEAIKYHSDR